MSCGYAEREFCANARWWLKAGMTGLLGWQIRKKSANISALPFFQKRRCSMDADRRTFTAGLAGFMLSTALSRPARAQQLETPLIRLGVANKAHLYYLPLTLAQRRGYLEIMV
jgi:hypothetical protein